MACKRPWSSGVDSNVPPTTSQEFTLQVSRTPVSSRVRSVEWGSNKARCDRVCGELLSGVWAARSSTISTRIAVLSVISSEAAEATTLTRSTAVDPGEPGL